MVYHKNAWQVYFNCRECSNLTILRIEKGQRFVPDYEIVLIAKFFNITTDELLGIKEAEQ